MSEKRVVWMGQAKKDLLAMPEAVRRTLGYALGDAQNGKTPEGAVRMAGNLRSVTEIRAHFEGDTYRLMYTHELGDVIYVLHAFKKKSKRGIATPAADIDRIVGRFKQARRDNLLYNLTHEPEGIGRSGTILVLKSGGKK